MLLLPFAGTENLISGLEVEKFRFELKTNVFESCWKLPPKSSWLKRSQQSGKIMSQWLKEISASGLFKQKFVYRVVLQINPETEFTLVASIFDFFSARLISNSLRGRFEARYWSLWVGTCRRWQFMGRKIFKFKKRRKIASLPSPKCQLHLDAHPPPESLQSSYNF